MKTIFKIPVAVEQLLSKKYNLIDALAFTDFYNDYDQLKEKLLTLKQEKYDINDRILISHTDTDFYFKQCNVGLHLLNFFTIIDQIDIPRYVLLFYTNHFGLGTEIKKLCKEEKDQPGVIESFVYDLHYNPEGYKDVDISLDKISHQALCMMNMIRSHRYALYHQIKDISDDNLIASYTGNHQ